MEIRKYLDLKLEIFSSNDDNMYPTVWAEAKEGLRRNVSFYAHPSVACRIYSVLCFLRVY